MSLLSIRDLSVDAPRGTGPTGALDGFDLDIGAGEHVALLGNRTSGIGLLQALLCPRREMKVQPARGTLWIQNEDEGRMSLSRALAARPGLIACADDDPVAALEDTRPLRDLVLQRHARVRRHDRDRILEAFRMTFQGLSGDAAPDLTAPGSDLTRRERCVASAAILFSREPRLVVSRDPQAMDPLHRTVYLSLVSTACRDRGTAHLVVTPLAGTAAGFSDRVAVVHMGRIVESGPTGDVLGAPRHPYTHLLRALDPGATRAGHRLACPEAALPIAGIRPEGCSFHLRCPRALAGCFLEVPELVDAGGRQLACHRPIGAHQ